MRKQLRTTIIGSLFYDFRHKEEGRNESSDLLYQNRASPLDPLGNNITGAHSAHEVLVHAIIIFRQSALWLVAITYMTPRAAESHHLHYTRKYPLLLSPETKFMTIPSHATSTPTVPLILRVLLLLRERDRLVLQFRVLVRRQIPQQHTRDTRSAAAQVDIRRRSVPTLFLFHFHGHDNRSSSRRRPKMTIPRRIRSTTDRRNRQVRVTACSSVVRRDISHVVGIGVTINCVRWCRCRSASPGAFFHAAAIV